MFWSCSSNGFFHRQYKHEPCPLLILLVQQHFPFQLFGDEAADIESQTGALPEVVGLFKTFEDGFRVFRGNAGTGIGDGEGDRIRDAL